jgi:beta-galactosidase
MRILPLADIDVVTLNVFSWAALQPSEDEYDFSDLDRIVDQVSANGMKICLATATGAHPAWMARKYPDILRVDIEGRKRKFGGRHNSCPNSPTYRKYAARLARRLAERYGKRDNLVAWHVSNEFGDACYCENCEKAFRVWLKARYGTIENVNRAWNTAFWGHTFYDFDDIVVPNNLSEQWNWHRTTFQGITLDYKRFNSESLLDCYRLERDAIRPVSPNVPITTNLMGFYFDLDYHRWAREMDFIAWDNYPSPTEPFTRTAMSHALMRGLKQGQPFWLMEQTPSVTNWQPYNALKRPGVLRLWSYQAIAQGADTAMYFQMRRSLGACEKFHGAVIDHCGHENTRVFREVAAFGKELTALGDAILGSVVKNRVAILFDWDNWWAIKYSAGPSVELDYPAEALKYYDAFARENLSADVVAVDADLSRYRVVVAPVLTMVKPGVADRLKAFARGGGTVVLTFFSGIVNETDIVTTKGYPGELRDLAGVWVEETDALIPGSSNSVTVADGPLAGDWPAEILCDVIHPETASVVGVYGRDFYAGTPAVTRNEYGAGECWYVCTSVKGEFLRRLAKAIAAKHGIEPVFPVADNLEATYREKDGRRFVFVLNHGDAPIDVTMPFAGVNLLDGIARKAGEVARIAAKDVWIVEMK